jgi:hypothetical protein
LQVDVSFNSSAEEVVVEADILDISYTGIRVKFKEPMSSNISGLIKITMILPESGLPFSVYAILKHSSAELECGVEYSDHIQGSIDDLMFECVELDIDTVLIKHL